MRSAPLRTTQTANSARTLLDPRGKFDGLQQRVSTDEADDLNCTLSARLHEVNLLVFNLACAFQFRSLLASGQNPDLPALMKSCGLSRQSPSEIAKLAFLAPQVQQALIDPHNEPSLTLRELANLAGHTSWAKQEHRLQALEKARV